jgi:hypothetical protein
LEEIPQESFAQKTVADPAAVLAIVDPKQVRSTGDSHAAEEHELVQVEDVDRLVSHRQYYLHSRFVIGVYCHSISPPLQLLTGVDIRRLAGATQANALRTSCFQEAPAIDLADIASHGEGDAGQCTYYCDDGGGEAGWSFLGFSGFVSIVRVVDLNILKLLLCVLLSCLITPHLGLYSILRHLWDDAWLVLARG